MDTSAIDPSLELSHIELSFEMLGDWLNERIIELSEGEETPETLEKSAKWLLPKLDQYERSMDIACYQVYQLVWEFLPARDLFFNYAVIHRVRRHRKLLLLNGIEPLRQFFNAC
jgi:hypothetical protein